MIFFPDFQRLTGCLALFPAFFLRTAILYENISYRPDHLKEPDITIGTASLIHLLVILITYTGT